MKSSKNRRAAILVVILLGLLVVLYKTLFGQSEPAPAPATDVNSLSLAGAVEVAVGGDISGVDIETLLSKLNRINLDTTIMQDEKFKSLKSIEIPLPSVPVGKTNPFSAPGSAKPK